MRLRDCRVADANTAPKNPILIVAIDVVPVDEPRIRRVVGEDDVAGLNHRIVFNGHVLGLVDYRELQIIALP